MIEKDIIENFQQRFDNLEKSVKDLSNMLIEYTNRITYLETEYRALKIFNGFNSSESLNYNSGSANLKIAQYED